QQGLKPKSHNGYSVCINSLAYNFPVLAQSCRFVSLSRPDADFNLIFLKTGLETFKPIHMRGHRADGLFVAFVVDDIDREYARLQSEGVTITIPIKTEP
ncbi:MAG: hypothetical protein V7L11_19200, partial [Nostoc sp.]